MLRQDRGTVFVETVLEDLGPVTQASVDGLLLLRSVLWLQEP